MTPDHDLRGKTIVVTGATGGIGRAAARMLAGRGASVLAVGRSPERCRETRDDILAEHPGARVSFAVADLSSQRQVRELACEIRERVAAEGGGKIDVLVNNAGVVPGWYTATEDGYEMQFAVNHLAPFLLTHELMPLLCAAPEARVVTVSSRSHRRARIRWSDIMHRRFYNCLLAYKQSKLANVLFTAELNRRVGPGSAVRAFAADPGLVNTGIGQKHTAGFVEWFWQQRRQRGATPEQGAETVVFLAADPSVRGARHVYWKNCRPLPPSRYAQREDVAARLWSLSERLCGVTWAE